jgi:hypothetical protein
MLLVLLLGISVVAWGQHAVDLPRNDDYVEIPNPLPEGSRALTVEAWINLKGLVGSDIFAGQATLGVNDPLTNVWNLQIMLSDTSVIISQFQLYDSGGEKNMVFFARSRRNQIRPTWNHFALVVDEFQSSFYMNGVSLRGYSGNVVLSSSLNFNPSSIIRLGQDPRFPSYPQLSSSCTWDEFRVWNIFRSAAEIREYMYKVLDGDEPGLVHYSKFEEGAGDSSYSLVGKTASFTL